MSLKQVKKSTKALFGAALMSLCLASASEPSKETQPERNQSTEAKSALSRKSELADKIYCSDLLKSIHEGEPAPSDLFLFAADLPKWCLDSVNALKASLKRN